MADDTRMPDALLHLRAPLQVMATATGRAAATPGNLIANSARTNGYAPSVTAHAPVDSGIIDLVDADDRSTFIIDLTLAPAFNPVYYNPSISKNRGLRDRIAGLGSLYNLKSNHQQGPDWAFLQWQCNTDAVGHGRTARYAQRHWVACTVNGRYRVISAVIPVQNLPAESSFTSHELCEQPFPSPDSVETPVAVVDKSLGKDGGDVVADHDAAVVPTTKDIQPPPDTNAEVYKQPVASFHNLDEPFPSKPTTPVTVGRIPIWDEVDGFLTKRWENIPDRLCPNDWTVPDDNVVVTPWIKWFRNYDWENTKLGSITKWPPELRRLCFELMADPRPAAAQWGIDHIMLYNEGYAIAVGGSHRHPRMLGIPWLEAWPELGDTFDVFFGAIEKEGKATFLDDACFMLEAVDGTLEERYFNCCVSPRVSDDPDIYATYNPIHETTRQVIAERRTMFLLQLGYNTASSRQLKDFWSGVLNVMEASVNDAPFGFVYSATATEVDLDDTVMSNIDRSVGGLQWVLEGAVAYPTTHVLPALLHGNETADFLPIFDSAIRSSKPTLLRRSDGTLPDVLLDGILSRSCGDACESAIFIPMRSTGENVAGFMVLGVNPRSLYDADYELFTSLLFRQLSTTLAATILFEEEIQRSRTAAEMAEIRRNELSEKLAIRTLQTVEAENRFRRLADAAPVGMFHFDAAGMPIYCNDVWYAMTDHTRGAEYPMSWYNVIHPEDHAMMDIEWAKLLAGSHVCFEMRLRKPFKAAEIVGGEQVQGFTWIIAAAYPTLDDKGEITNISGCITDISRQKWAEDFQTRRMHEAMELKRTRENFIDMTSHEMRNPLSAILQCADWIGNSLLEFGISTASSSDAHGAENTQIPTELLASHLDAAQTIVLCAQHQKRIIDDVLTLSKLDSNLLLITPVDVQPAIVIENSLRMFDAELQKADVELRFKIDPSYEALSIDWMKLDPSRMLQIIFNLLTNAIKFTQPEAQRKIVVTITASLTPQGSTAVEIPYASEDVHSIKSKTSLRYLPRKPNRPDATTTPEWGTGEIVYLGVQVCDTGRGLDEDEQQLLFQRFSQTSPRTHVQYGGSGLGLFISRELTELQGGEIGVCSTAGKGSTFAFFVKARRTDPPANVHRISGEVATGVAAMQDKSHEQRNGTNICEQARKKRKLSMADYARHVLVVEDNLVNQKVLSKQLQSAGCIVSVANHGGEALACLERSRHWVGCPEGQEINVVLMDVEMPVLDGLSCVREIRRLQREGSIVDHVPVIAVTANARSEQIARAKDAGMDGVVTKPFRIPELIPEVERLVLLATAYGAVGA